MAKFKGLVPRFMPFLGGLTGGLLSATALYFLLSPEKTLATSELFYDFQILFTGAAALGAAGIAYLAVLNQIHSDREKEEWGRQRRSYALVLELTRKAFQVSECLIDAIESAEGEIRSLHRAAKVGRTFANAMGEIRAVNCNYIWSDLADLDGRVAQKLHLFLEAKRRIEQRPQMSSQELSVALGYGKELLKQLTEEERRLSEALGIEGMEDYPILNKGGQT